MTILLKLYLKLDFQAYDTVCANASFNFHSRWSHCYNSVVIMLLAALHVRLINCLSSIS